MPILPLSLALTLATPAFATDACQNLCRALDAAEEQCEAAYGDGGFCATIGSLEETCDPEDGGTTQVCEDLCAKADALDDDCDGALGAEDPVCQSLDAIAVDCEDGRFDGVVPEGDEDDDDDDPSATRILGCAARGPGAAGGAVVALMLPLFALRRRRAR